MHTIHYSGKDNYIELYIVISEREFQLLKYYILAHYRARCHNPMASITKEVNVSMAVRVW